MITKNQQESYETYLLKIVGEFDTNDRILKAPEQGYMKRYYASLCLYELRSRLRCNVAYCENHEFPSCAYEEAKRRVLRD